MLLQSAAGSVLPYLFHILLLECTFKTNAASLSGIPLFLGLLVSAATACLGLLARLVTRFTLLRTDSTTSSARSLSLPCQPLLLVALGILKALSLGCFYQAFTCSPFPPVLLSALVAKLVFTDLLSQPVAQLKACLVQRAPACALILIGLVAYAFFRPQLPYGAYNGSPLAIASLASVAASVAFDSMAELLVLPRAADTSDRSDEAQQSPAFRWEIQQWDHLVASVCFFAATLLHVLFGGASNEERQAGPQQGSALLDYATLGMSMALSTTLANLGSSEAKVTSPLMSNLLAVPVNAAVLGYFRSFGAVGWLGVAWIAAGIVCVNCPSPLSSSTSASHSSTEKGSGVLLFSSVHSHSTDEADEEALDNVVDTAANSKSKKWSQAGFYFVIAAVLPVMTALCFSSISRFLQPMDTHSNLRSDGLIGQSVNDSVVIEGAQWAITAHQALSPECPKGVDAQRYERKHLHTALATWPRSGNSWTRMLIERASGYRTSTLYCDGLVEDIFLDDCYHDGKFLEKTHFPYLGDSWGWTRYEKVVRPIRNPLDATYSFWHLWESIRRGEKSHTERYELDHPLGAKPEEKEELLKYARSWVDHDDYWNMAPIPQYIVLYEDLRQATMPHLMAMLSFFMPAEDLPPLSRVTCAMELNEGLQPYQSAKRDFFYSWDLLDVYTREEILMITQLPFCRLGYDRLWSEMMEGIELPFDCRQVRLENGPSQPS